MSLKGRNMDCLGTLNSAKRNETERKNNKRMVKHTKRTI